MLNWLKIKNLALVEDAEVEFCKGFNVLTGETGAGKSVIINAISLILGKRSDKSLIRSGEKRCELTAEIILNKSTKKAKSNYDNLIKNWQFRKDQYYANTSNPVKPEDYEEKIEQKPESIIDKGANGGGDGLINLLYEQVQPYIGNPLKLIKTERDEIREIGPALANIKKGKFSFVDDDRKKPESIKGKREKFKHASRETYDRLFIKGIDMRRVFRMHRPATEKVPEIKEMGKVFDGFIKTILDNFYESFLDTMAMTYEGRKVTADLVGASAYYKIEHANELLGPGIDDELLSCCKRYYNSINLLFLKLVKSSFTPDPSGFNDL